MSEKTITELINEIVKIDPSYKNDRGILYRMTKIELKRLLRRKQQNAKNNNQH